MTWAYKPSGVWRLAGDIPFAIADHFRIGPARVFHNEVRLPGGDAVPVDVLDVPGIPSEIHHSIIHTKLGEVNGPEPLARQGVPSEPVVL